MHLSLEAMRYSNLRTGRGAWIAETLCMSFVHTKLWALPSAADIVSVLADPPGGLNLGSGFHYLVAEASGKLKTKSGRSHAPTL